MLQSHKELNYGAMQNRNCKIQVLEQPTGSSLSYYVFFNHCRAPQALSACAAVLVPPCAMHRVLLQQRRRSGAAAAGLQAAPTRRTGAVRSEALSTPPQFGAAPPPAGSGPLLDVTKPLPEPRCGRAAARFGRRPALASGFLRRYARFCELRVA